MAEIKIPLPTYEQQNELISENSNEGRRLKKISEEMILDIPTYDGNPSVTHPSVLRFDNEWNGYRFWMAFTPFPDDTRENPSIVASNDGVNWVVPNGLTNPIEDYPGSPDFNSDTELVFYEEENKLRCYYRTVKPLGTTTLYYKESSDGVTWSNVVTCSLTPYQDPISPSIVKYSGNVWKMWVGENSTLLNRRMALYESSNGIDWTRVSTCRTGLENIGYIFHMSVQHIRTGYVCVAQISPNTVGDSAHTQGEIFFGTSRDGINWEFDRRSIVSLRTTENDRRLYRPYLLTYGDKWKLYYVREGQVGGWRILLVDVEYRPQKPNEVELSGVKIVSERVDRRVNRKTPVGFNIQKIEGAKGFMCEVVIENIDGTFTTGEGVKLIIRPETIMGKEYAEITTEAITLATRSATVICYTGLQDLPQRSGSSSKIINTPFFGNISSEVNITGNFDGKNGVTYSLWVHWIMG